MLGNWFTFGYEGFPEEDRGMFYSQRDDPCDSDDERIASETARHDHLLRQARRRKHHQHHSFHVPLAASRKRPRSRQGVDDVQQETESGRQHWTTYGAPFGGAECSPDDFAFSDDEEEVRDSSSSTLHHSGPQPWHRSRGNFHDNKDNDSQPTTTTTTGRSGTGIASLQRTTSTLLHAELLPARVPAQFSSATVALPPPPQRALTRFSRSSHSMAESSTSCCRCSLLVNGGVHFLTAPTTGTATTGGGPHRPSMEDAGEEGVGVQELYPHSKTVLLIPRRDVSREQEEDERPVWDVVVPAVLAPSPSTPPAWTSSVSLAAPPPLPQQQQPSSNTINKDAEWLLGADPQWKRWRKGNVSPTAPRYGHCLLRVASCSSPFSSSTSRGSSSSSSRRALSVHWLVLLGGTGVGPTGSAQRDEACLFGLLAVQEGDTPGTKRNTTRKSSVTKPDDILAQIAWQPPEWSLYGILSPSPSSATSAAAAAVASSVASVGEEVSGSRGSGGMINGGGALEEQHEVMEQALQRRYASWWVLDEPPPSSWSSPPTSSTSFAEEQQQHRHAVPNRQGDVFAEEEAMQGEEMVVGSMAPRCNITPPSTTVWVFGGTLNGSTPVASQAVLSVLLDISDRRVEVIEVLTMGLPPCARFGHAAAQYLSSRGSPSFLVQGGVDCNGQTLRDCFVLDKGTLVWQEVYLPSTSPLTPLRSFHHIRMLADNGVDIGRAREGSNNRTAAGVHDADVVVVPVRDEVRRLHGDHNPPLVAPVVESGESHGGGAPLLPPFALMMGETAVDAARGRHALVSRSVSGRPSSLMDAAAAASSSSSSWLVADVAATLRQVQQSHPPTATETTATAAAKHERGRGGGLATVASYDPRLHRWRAPSQSTLLSLSSGEGASHHQQSYLSEQLLRDLLVFRSSNGDHSASVAADRVDALHRLHGSRSAMCYCSCQDEDEQEDMENDLKRGAARNARRSVILFGGLGLSVPRCAISLVHPPPQRLRDYLIQWLRTAAAAANRTTTTTKTTSCRVLPPPHTYHEDHGSGPHTHRQRPVGGSGGATTVAADGCSNSVRFEETEGDSHLESLSRFFSMQELLRQWHTENRNRARTGQM